MYRPTPLLICRRLLRSAGTAILKRFFTLLGELPPLCGVHSAPRFPRVAWGFVVPPLWRSDRFFLAVCSASAGSSSSSGTVSSSCISRDRTAPIAGLEAPAIAPECCYFARRFTAALENKQTDKKTDPSSRARVRMPRSLLKHFFILLVSIYIKYRESI